LGGNGGLGGGGQGGNAGRLYGNPGTANTGGGGGGSYNNDNNTAVGGKGGSGVVIIRYQLTSDGVSPYGLSRYNTDLRNIEIYEGPVRGWVILDPSRNFGGHNLALYSEDASNWSLGSVTVSTNSTTAPDGTLTADLAIPTASNVFHRVARSLTSLTIGQFYTASVYAKAGGYNVLNFRFDGQDSTAGYINVVSFDLSTGNVTVSGYYDNNVQGSTPLDYSITNVGNGWYRCSVTVQLVGTTTTYLAYHVASSATVSQFTGNGTSGIYFWGMQVEQARYPGVYTRTVDAISPLPTSMNGFRTHNYTATGTASFVPATTGTVEVLVVAGGGAGGSNYGGGGGAGGLIYNTSYPVVSGTVYTVTVGAGGVGINSSDQYGGNGGNSQFGSLIAIGGGGGGYQANAGRSGGSGGGAGGNGTPIGGAGVVGQGNKGGDGSGSGVGAGGGGGAGGMGQGLQTGSGAAKGGNGIAISISGNPIFYAGGGGGWPSQGAGLGGGGAYGVNATANTGGGGGSWNGSAIGNGGTGIVIVRYRYD
jgi:hypothetical protein